MRPAYNAFIYRIHTPLGTPLCMGLPIITSVTKTYDVDLKDALTIVFGTDRNYLADLGTSTRYQVFMERVNPANPDDS
jgi:hypothetical protein